MKVFQLSAEVCNMLDACSYRIGLLNCIQDDQNNKEVYQKLLDLIDCAASNRDLTPKEEIIFSDFITLRTTNRV